MDEKDDDAFDEDVGLDDADIIGDRVVDEAEDDDEIKVDDDGCGDDDDDSGNDDDDNDWLSLTDEFDVDNGVEWRDELDVAEIPGTILVAVFMVDDEMRAGICSNGMEMIEGLGKLSIVRFVVRAEFL